jgi:acyl-CoA thioester hydrolase
MHDHLQAFPVVIAVPVAWGDMDAFAHVNNTRYFRWFESARIAYFDQLAWPAIRADTGIGPILAATDCHYKAPLTYPDTVQVGARIEAMGQDRFRMLYTLVSRRLWREAARGSALVVAYDYRASRKTAIPDVLREAIRNLEGRVGHMPEEMESLPP